MNALCSLRTYEQPRAANVNKFKNEESFYQLKKTGSSYQSTPVWQPVRGLRHTRGVALSRLTQGRSHSPGSSVHKQIQLNTRD